MPVGASSSRLAQIMDDEVNLLHGEIACMDIVERELQFVVQLAALVDPAQQTVGGGMWPEVRKIEQGQFLFLVHAAHEWFVLFHIVAWFCCR